MNTISINIDAQVKDHFNHFIETHGHSTNDHDRKIAKEKINEIRNTSTDGYVIDQLSSLQLMITMVEDTTWQISDEKRQKINATISYFISETDVIPDTIPGLGFIDDCIVIDSTMDYVEEDLLEFKDFCRARMVYGKNGLFTMADWLSIKDQETFSRIRNRRYRRSSLSRDW